MDNKSIKKVKRGFFALTGLLIIFSIVIAIGVELPGFNHWNPLYNPYYFILFALITFMAQTQFKEKKTIWNSIGFFERSGLTTMYDVPYEDISPTHISYVSKDGERHSIKHSHPFAIPSEDGYDNVYLTPKNVVQALNPSYLYNKYLKKLGEDKLSEIKAIINTFNDSVKTLGLPENEALNPDNITIDNSENDDPDTLMQEVVHHVSDIRKGFQGKGSTQDFLIKVALGVLVGMAIVTFMYIGLGVDFRGVLNR